MMIIKSIVVVITLAGLIVPQFVAAEFVLRTPKTTVSTYCDPFTCQLPKEIMITERFLRDRKYGLPYTPDPRPLTPFVEVLRLNQLSQTLGYLNLYKYYRTEPYRTEALNRVNYFLELGPGALGNGPRDGMIAYTYFEAYKLFPDARYLAVGRLIADECVARPDADLMMNGGLMCALGLASGYQVTGNAVYRDTSRRVTANSAPKQFTDGAFPHQATIAAGKNMGYTAWMAVEMLMLGTMDPADPYTDFLLLKSQDFLSKRFNPDGTYNVFDENERYDYESGVPGTSTTVGPFDTAGMFSMSLNMYATGRKDIAAKTLRLALSQRMGGTDYGGYPDNTSGIMSGNIWTDGRPSILRTSLIFWYMTLFQLLTQKCPAGPQVACSTSLSNCSPVMSTIGVCTPPKSGTQTCLVDRYSQCLDLAPTRMQSGQACGQSVTCEGAGGSACYTTCTLYGSQYCYSGTCAPLCLDINVEGQPLPTCLTQCFENRTCSGFAITDETQPEEPVYSCTIQS